MIKISSLDLSNLRQMFTHIFISAFTVFLSTLIIQAQPEFSKDELRSLKEGKPFSDAFKYRLPQEKFPMSETSNQNRSMIADGDLDSTFNASATEAFGYVNETVVQPDGQIIAVGLFQRANGTRTNGIARFNSDGTIDTTFNSGTGANAAVRAVVLQSDGKIIVGGAFTSFNGQTVNRIVRLNSNGSIDSSFGLATTLGGQINDILILPDGKILVGGAFSVSSSRLIRLNSNGTLDSAISGFNGIVNTLSLAPTNKIMVGGEFSAPYSLVARLNSDGTVDSTFNPSGSGDAPVYKTLVQPNGKILVAGAFKSFNGTFTDGLVRLNDNGTVDSAFEITNNPQLDFLAVYDLALQPDGKILANFFNDGYEAFADVWRFNPDATRDLTFNTNSNNSLTAVDMNLLSDGKVLLSGYFVSVNNQPHVRLLKLNSDGSLDNAFNPALSSVGIVYAIKRQPDGKLLIGGDFEFVNGNRKSAIARLNQDGSVDNTFTIGAGFLGDIYAIDLQSDGKIIIGGLFSGDSNFPASSVARLNSDGSFDRSLNNGNIASVAYAVSVQNDGKILVGGVVYDVSGQPIALNRVLANGNWDSSFLSPQIPTGSIRSILSQPNGKIIFGGTFFPLGGGTLQRNGIARINNDGSLDSGFSTLIGNVFSLKQQSNGQIYAGGLTLTRFSSDGIVDSTLNVGSGFTGLIRAVEIQQDGKIVLGGTFTSYNGSAVNRLIRISNVGALDAAFTPSPAGNIFALNLQADGKIVVGGQFLDFNGTEKLSLVRLQNSSAAPRRAPFDFDGDGKTDISIFRPTGGEWWYQRSSDGQVPAAQFGSGTDKIVPGDYTGDGKTDFAFFRPSTGQWFVLRSEDYSFYAFPFGAAGDIPVPADFDGDGKTDPTVFRPSNGSWYIIKSTGGVISQQFGLNGDVPVVADYDGDGKADLAITRINNGNREWWINRSNSGLLAVTFGESSDRPVPGDYTGDGKADVAFFRPSTGQWFVLRSENFSFYAAPFGGNGDVPVPGDYDGDGRFDFAVFRSSNSGWYINRSTAGIISQQFGFPTDQPIPSAFVP